MCDPEKPVERNANLDSHTDGNYATGLIESILLDCLNLNPSYEITDYQLDVRTLRKRVNNEGLYFVTHILPHYFGEITLALEGGQPDYREFRKSPIDNRPVFLHRLVAQVLDGSDGDTVAFHCLYMVCHAFKKLKGPYPEVVLRDSLRKFINSDAHLLSQNYQKEDIRAITTEARRLVTILFKDIDIDGNLKPRPGPGATNTPLKHHMRFEPHVLYDQLEDSFPADDFFYSSKWDLVTRAQEYIGLDKADYPRSRFKFIHKYRGKPRGICIEENETQFCQQAVKRLLYKHIENHPMTRGRICFTDQSVNQVLALKSSVSRHSATIDMSEASDRVSRDLVFTLFRDTELLPYLDACSTRFIDLPDVEGVDTRSILGQKFAPMGSGVCFPIMATVHWALLRAIMTITSGITAKEDCRHIFVYGDDIIVPTAYVDTIYSILPRYGMKVNVDKSFVNSFFRESCGVHAYKGVDVTPVYNNYTHNSALKSTNSNVLLSAVAKEFSYYTSGFTSAANFVRKRMSLTYGQLPFCSPSSKLLGWKRDNFDFTSQQINTAALRSRYKPDYQCMEYLLRVVTPRFARDDETVEDSRAYLRWMLLHTRNSASFSGSVEDLVIRRQWVLQSALG